LQKGDRKRNDGQERAKQRTMDERRATSGPAEGAQIVNRKSQIVHGQCA
jgi:hypothetical protein